MKIDSRDKHLLSLIPKGADSEGWAPVSELVWPFVDKLPSELVEKEKKDVGGRVRLTDKGQTVLEWT